jgi:parallel beta-helix repeat protein
MSSFTKTLIVDGDLSNPQPPYFKTIYEAAKYFKDNSTGGTIIVESGTYDIDNTGNQITVQIPNNTTIIGSGNVVVNVMTNITAFRNSDFDGGNENITISGFKIICATSTLYQSNLIDFRNVKNCIIEKLYITGEGASQGIDLNTAAIKLLAQNTGYCTDNIITQCTIKNYGKVYDGTDKYGVGIVLHGDSDHCNRNKIKNNFVSQCNNGFYLYNASDSVLSGNSIFDIQNHYPYGGVGIMVGNSNNIIISGNHMSNNNEHGIYLSGCDGSTVRGNICYSNGEDGIKLRHSGDSTPTQHCTIVGNICCENGLDGYGDGINICAYSNHNVIYGNCCIKNKTCGIRNGEPAFPNTIGHNNISGNVCVLRDSHDDWDNPIQIDKYNCDGVIAADNIGDVVIEDQ